MQVKKEKKVSYSRFELALVSCSRNPVNLFTCYARLILFVLLAVPVETLLIL